MDIPTIVRRLDRPPHTVGIDEVSWLLAGLRDQQLEIVRLQDLLVQRNTQLISANNRLLEYQCVAQLRQLLVRQTPATGNSVPQ